MLEATQNENRTHQCLFTRPQWLILLAFLLGMVCPCSSAPSHGNVTQLVRKGKLVYHNNFDCDQELGKEWLQRHDTRWKISGGVLLGQEATKEDQQRKINNGARRVHSGFTPRLFYQYAPRDFVSSFRIRFIGGGPPSGLHPHIEWGHHLLRIYWDEEVDLSDEPYGKESAPVAVSMPAVGAIVQTQTWEKLNKDSPAVVLSWCQLNGGHKIGGRGEKYYRNAYDAYKAARIGEKALYIVSPKAGHEYDLYHLNEILDFFDKHCK
jgi:hypothetical protein